MTLTSELDLDIFTPNLHDEIQACMSVRLARMVRQTDGHTHTHTDTQTDNAKTITPSADAGCKKQQQISGVYFSFFSFIGQPDHDPNTHHCLCGADG